MLTFARISLARYFLLASLLILVVGMVVIGLWVGQQIETGVTQRTAALTALYVDSLVGHHLPPFAETAQLDPSEWEPLDMLFANSAMGRTMASFRLWGPDGSILYSTDKSLIGQKFPVSDALSNAFSGHVQSSLVEAVDPPYTPQGQPTRLIQTYAPVHTSGANKIVAVAEFQQSAADLDRIVQTGQQRTWAVVAVATLVMYMLLAGLVGRASVIISRQERERLDRVKQLTGLLEQNARLNDRVQSAAARSTALNEQFLRRLSSDLHDGPCQDLGLALLRIEALSDGSPGTPPVSSNGYSPASPGKGDFQTVQTAMQAALTELRTISTGLWMPELEHLSLSEVAERAVHDYESKTGVEVVRSIPALPQDAPLPVKITLYRVLQEALINGFRHDSATGQAVRLWEDDGHLSASVVDNGTGFDTQAVANKVTRNGHLGLVGMRERVEMLGGAFAVQTAPGQGTSVLARLPLTLPEDELG